MSWGNGNKGPWGPPSGGSGGSGSGGGGGQKPEPPQTDLEDVIRRAQESLKSLLGVKTGKGGGNFGGRATGGDGGNNKRTAVIVSLVLLVLWMSSGVYRVNPDELGIVLRFGAFHRKADPGLNYHLPYPIESVLVPSVTSINKIEVGYRSGLSERSNAGGAASGFEKESQMLTGDRNIVDIDFEVQWKIDSEAPQDFLFNVRNPAEMIKPVAESAMREVIARHDLGGVLTTAQSEIAEDTRTIMQDMLDSYNAGVEVVAVNLSRPDVPPPVIDEFQDVKRAEQDRSTAESVAEGYSNDIMPKAKGQAVQMIQEATAYKSKVVADAQGNVSRFLAVYKEYSQSKDVTRQRMYLETMEEVLDGMPKVIIDSKNSNGVMPYLPLPELKKKEK